MDERNRAKVYFRVFPNENMDWGYVKILNDSKTVYIRNLQQLVTGKKVVEPLFWIFKTNKVFYNDTQTDIYKVVAKNLIESLLSGKDGVIVGYGQTGTGKSLTLNGLHNAFEDRGILLRLISDIFELLESKILKPNLKMCIQVSYLEFSHCLIFDLLKEYPNVIHNLKDMTKLKVKSASEAIKLIFQGEGRRECVENASYVSHINSSVFTVYVTIKNTEMQTNIFKKFKLHVVDMAGADTVGNNSCLLKKGKQIGSANLTKSVLEQFFLVLSRGMPDSIRVKHRLSPMVQFLGDSLSRTSNLRTNTIILAFSFIGHIRIDRQDLVVTLSMLRFGQIISGLKVLKKYSIRQSENNHVASSFSISNSKGHYNNKILDQDLSQCPNESQFQHIKRTVDEYLQDNITEATLINVCDLRIVLEILKAKCYQLETENIPTHINNEDLQRCNSIRKKSPTSIRTSNQLSSSQVFGWKSCNTLQSLLSTAEKSQKKLMSSQSISPHPKSKSSSASSTKLKKRSSVTKSEIILNAKILPLYKEKWLEYTKEKHDEYIKLNELYKDNALEVKKSHQKYLAALEKLKNITAKLETLKNNLAIAKMNQEFYSIDEDNNGFYANFIKCAIEEVNKVQKLHAVIREDVLSSHSIIMCYIKACEKIKKELQDNFDKFCNAKYNTAIPNLEENPLIDNIEDILQSGKLYEDPIVDVEAKQFEDYKILIRNEQIKTRQYKAKHRQWIN